MLLNREVYVVDAYNHLVYPADDKAKAAIHTDITISFSTTKQHFLHNIHNKVNTAIQQF